MPRDGSAGPDIALAETVAALVELQKRRLFCINSQSRIDRSCDSFIARTLGYGDELSEKERTAIYAQAAAMRKSVEKGGDAPVGGEGHDWPVNHLRVALSACTPIILHSHASRIGWDSFREQTEGAMRKLASSLPVMDWARGVAGFGELGVALVVGEAGDLSNYATKERVWKRLGLAVIEGGRQRRRSGAAEAKMHGYNPRRRSQVWVIADSMFRHQVAGDKDEDGKSPAKSGKPIAIPARPTGPYGRVFYRRREHVTPRIEATAHLPAKIIVGGREVLNPEKWTPLRCVNDAKRVMSKALLRDMWRVWNGYPPLADDPAEAA